jgi:parallel beta-helix repeat protein
MTASLRRVPVLALWALFTAAAIAGPITPPPGPVAPTPGPEPRTPISLTTTPGDNDATPSLYKITQPGSNYLTGNITGVAGKHGIEIAASGVTLDLNGFDLVGVPGMGAFDGVSVTVDGLRSIAVLNGSARNWGDGGVDLGFLSRGCRVDGVRASGNAGTGITTSISSTVSNCTSVFNGQRGIRASNASTISNCSVESNSGTGIEVNNGCTISNCAAYFNAAVGILTNVGCTVLDCSAYQNTGNGVQVGESSSVSRCSAMNNSANGFSASDFCKMSECNSSFNSADGIIGADGLAVSSCTVRRNGGDGIQAGNTASVRGCTVNRNGANGIVTGGDSAVVECTVSEHLLDEIKCTFRCDIRLNSCNNEFAIDHACIHATGSDNRIEKNRCQGGSRGIEVGGSSNIIVGNLCANCGVYFVFAANNYYGPIIDRTLAFGPAFSGFFAPSTLNTTDPNANFPH